MSATLSLKAYENSTYIVNATFFDESEVAVVPNSITWRLTTATGVVINGRDEVSVTPANSVDIVLQGNDLQIASDSIKTDSRIVTVWGTYNSSYGSNLPYSHAVTFNVQNLVGRP